MKMVVKTRSDFCKKKMCTSNPFYGYLPETWRCREAKVGLFHTSVTATCHFN